MILEEGKYFQMDQNPTEFVLQTFECFRTSTQRPNNLIIVIFHYKSRKIRCDRGPFRLIRTTVRCTCKDYSNCTGFDGGYGRFEDGILSALSVGLPECL